jgi:hypothetical protein
MAMDSSSELLFRIGADATDAETNLARFRALLSKDLSDLKNEFADWSNKVFGDVTSVQGAMLAGTAAIAAGSVALVAALHSAAEKASEYALSMEEGSERTGMAVEDLSRLRYAAQATQTPYEALVRGLTMFASTVDKARDASSQQAAQLHRLGISQAEIEAGAQNIVPLFMRVADAFHNDATAVERAAMARNLFARGGPELIEMLSRGSEWLRQMGDDAERLGLVITEKDVIAAKELKAAMLELKAEKDALAIEWGKAFIPIEKGALVALQGAVAGIKSWAHGGDFLSSFLTGMDIAAARIQQRVQAGMAEAGQGLGAPGGAEESKAKEATKDFSALSSMLDQVKQRLGAARGEEEGFVAEMISLQGKMNAAHEEVIKLLQDGKITPETAAREISAFQQLVEKVPELVEAHTKQVTDKRNQAIERANQDLQQRLVGQQQQSWQQEEAAWDEQVEKLRLRLEKEGTLTAENEAKLVELHRAGLARIERDRLGAYTRQLEDLQQLYAAMVTGNFTTIERLKFQYDQDLAQFSAAKEAEAEVVAKTEGEKRAIEAMYELGRQAALQRYQIALNQLYNSTGWKGVFGSLFAQSIRGNEKLLREWMQAFNQAILMVRVAIESLNEDLQHFFVNYSDAMAQNITQAVVYRKSIGEAMAEATKAALAQLAAEAYVQAIYATALGFLRLAMWDFSGAAAAFEAAAIFATVGTAAALAGRAIPSSQNGGKAGGAGEAGGGAGGPGGTSGGTAAAGGSAGTVIININGHVVGRTGIEELTDMINEAVQDRDVRLIATATRQAGTVTK